MPKEKDTPDAGSPAIVAKKNELGTVRAIKCVADGIFAGTGFDGPSSVPASARFRRIRRAEWNKLAEQTTIPEDYQKVFGMTLSMFVNADCAVLDDPMKEAIWEGVLKTAEVFWVHEPLLSGPFPKTKFKQPTMVCATTMIQTLAVTLDEEWFKAQ